MLTMHNTVYLGLYLTETRYKGLMKLLMRQWAKEYRSDGLIHVLKYGCMLILVLCRQFKIRGHVVHNLDEYMKTRLVKSILKPMSICMENSAKQVMKIRRFR